MNKEIVEGLKELYAAPLPAEKEQFLEKLALRDKKRTGGRFGCGKFLLSQIRYMRKYNFLISMGLFCFVLAGAGSMSRDMLWGISAFVPFLALSAVLESRRSVRCGMEELEMASKFSLKSVLLARLIILGISNVVLLGGILPAMLAVEMQKLLYTGVYILLPYLLTAFFGLCLTRKIRGRECEPLCFFAAAFVSLGFGITRNIFAWIYEASYYQRWTAAVVIFIVLTGRECMTLLKEAEEYAWNL